MEDRLRFILDAGDRGHGLNRVNHFYKDQFDTVHVDESWFYLERITNEIERLQNAGSVNGWRFRMKTQPAQSPDLNILDLGFFHSLKTRAAHMKVVAKNKTQLVAKIKLAYQQYPAETLDHIWASLFAVYNCILQCNGDNQYSLPHSGARLRHKNATTGVDLNMDVIAYNLVFNALN